ncbi:C-type mannose receptor 2-like [Plakobranchus ocellatus]|uniref:C-type mannose receptor 2-like n=1 Tax=Plakobranchus ocellatus TaxID=259542 RepID=A0AAV4B8T6_9GAST|nr:C-type mannose receptor 2-like [Plakobranchus ocellatus]
METCVRAFSEMRLTKSWHKARDYCQRKKGDLVVIRDSNMTNFTTRLLGNLFNSSFWIGLHNTGILTEDDNRWRWLDENEKALYTHWAEGYPKNVTDYGSEPEQCAWVWNENVSDAYWLSSDCNVKLMYICEKSICKH